MTTAFTAAIVEAQRGGAKYRRIVDAMLDEMRHKPQGERLPSERVLAERFEVSRMTLRQALDELEQAGWIERVHGSGTFVRRPVVSLGQVLTSFTQDMRARGLTPSATLLGFDVVPAPAEVASELGLPAGEEVVWIERLRFAEGEPMCVEVSHFPIRFRQLLETGDLESSVHDLLRGSGVNIASLVRRVCARTATSRTARLLDLSDNASTLEIDDVFADDSQQPVQHARSYYRPDRYVVSVQVRAHADAPTEVRA